MEQKVIQLEKADNVRDLGGYKTLDGRRVKFQKVIRSAAIDQITSADQAKLSRYGVRQVVDFRSPEEEEAQPDKPIPQAANLFIPVFSVDETQVSISPQKLFAEIQNGFSAKQQMQRVYRHFVESSSARQAFRRYLDTLLTNELPTNSVLFHCTAGKDRTGFGAALLLKILQVDDEQVFADYLATNRFLERKTAEMLQQAAAQGAPAPLQQGIRELMQADRSYLTESFTSIDENFGDFDGFLANGLSLSKSERQMLRQLYTE